MDQLWGSGQYDGRIWEAGSWENGSWSNGGWACTGGPGGLQPGQQLTAVNAGGEEYVGYIAPNGHLEVLAFNNGTFSTQFSGPATGNPLFVPGGGVAISSRLQNPGTGQVLLDTEAIGYDGNVWTAGWYGPAMSFNTFTWANNFDSSGLESQWFTGNGAGFDNGKGWARSQPNNGWVNTGTSAAGVWNSLNTVQSGSFSGHRYCEAYAWVAASSNIGANKAKLDVWSGSTLLGESIVSPGNNGTYVLYAVPFLPPASNQVLFVAGIFGGITGQWMRVDDVSIWCSN